MDEQALVAIDELDDIETLVAVHGTIRNLDSTGHICFAVATAVTGPHFA